MQQVGQRQTDTKQWTTGTSGWGQKTSDNEVDWTQGPSVSTPGHTAAAPSKVLWSSSGGESKNALETGSTSKSGNLVATSSSSTSESNSDKPQSSPSVMANLSASISWGASVSTASGLDSSLWSGMSTSSSATNPTWGSSTIPGTLSLNTGHNMQQIGASSVGDNQNSNGSASAGGWGLSPMNQNGASLPGALTQASNMPSSSQVQQSSPSSLASSQSGPFGTNTMPWQNSSKPFGMRDFTQTSDSNWNAPPSSIMSSKEGSNSIAGAITDSGKMDLAAGLANLGIDKTAPPPEMNWGAMKSGWNGSGGMDPSKLPEGAVGSPSDLSFAQATQKGLKPMMGNFPVGVLSAKEEEIRRAIDTHEGWGTRPVRQDTSWDIESSPKASRKVSAENAEMAASNVWNNNNGTAIWESTRESQAPSWGGGAAAGGNVFADKDPSSWNMPPKPNMDAGNWGGGSGNNPMGNNPMGNNPMGNNPMGNNPMGNNPMGNNPMGNNPMGNNPMGNNPMGNNPMGNNPMGNNPMGNNPMGNNPMGNNPMGNNPMGNNPMGNNPMGNNPMGNNPMGNNPMGNNPMSDKSIGTWGGESQQSSNKLWGAKTETGSWNEPPQNRSNMTWGGQETDVGTWEDPASAASRRIVSSSGAGPIPMAGSGNSMNMGSNNMPPVGGGNMGMGGSNNMGAGSMNMPMGGGGGGMGGNSMNMGMGGGNNMPMPMGGGNNMNMPGMGGGSNMNMPMGGNGSNMNMPGMGGGNNMNMPMGGGNNMNMPMGGGGENLYWNDPNAKPQGWNPNGPHRPKPDEPWNKQGMGRPGGNSGWGDPSGNGSQKVDDGTSIWAANAQEQARAAGWGEPGAMWNPAFGARPKSTSWAGNDPENWQRKMSCSYETVQQGHQGSKSGSETESSENFEVGDWDDIAQSLPREGRRLFKMDYMEGQQRFPGSGGGQPQMRSKLIQQLMDMGFKKEEAQAALISNNMNFESALGELTSSALHKKDMENDVFQANGAKIHRQGFMPDNPGMIGDDISDNRSDSNPHVPNFPMQNAPFNNAQVPNQPFMSGGVNMFDRSKGGPPMPPNSGGMNNNLQHKLKVLQQQGGSAPPINNLSPSQGVVRGGSLPGTNTPTMVQQQAAQQQILQQLRLAVQSGLISPQLLNQQLPHNILVMLQQLLQLQNALQNLMQRQQFLQQNKISLNIPRPQLEQVSVMITQYKSQILSLQKQLQAAQQSMLMKQQPPSAPTPTPQQMQQMTQQPPMGMPPPIPSSMPGEGGEAMMSMPGDMSAGANNTAASMSRLNQWKQLTPERDGQVGGIDLNKAPGSKPAQSLQHSHSTPTIGPFGDLAGLNIGGDTTWSSTATSGATNWPSTSGDNGSRDGKNEDGTPPSSAGGLPMLGGAGGLGLSTDVIPEFVPGKPWQGLSSKSVEDDPHITPGSISRSLSVNVVKDDYLNNLNNLTAKSSPSFGADPTWSMGGGKLNSSGAETSMANAMTLGASNLQAQQASNNRAGGNNGQWQGTGGFNRQHSWAGRSATSAFTQVSGSGWESRQSSMWMKNLTPEEEQ